MSKIKLNIAQEIKQAVECLNKARLVAFPTETVYGLGADAENPEAVAKIFEVKKRPADHPVIIHIYDEKELKRWVTSVPEKAKKLIRCFWPGPLTLIFKAKKNVSPLITGNQKTIGIRMPSHPVARALLKKFGRAIAAPSANRFGKISPTRASHVQKELGKHKELGLIIKKGECAFGIESTIIDVTSTPARLLRPGPLTGDLIKQYSGVSVSNQKNKKNMPRVSGSLASHYAPKTPLYLFDVRSPPFSKHIAVMALHAKPRNFTGYWVKMPREAALYARQLYTTLHRLDAKKIKALWVEMPPDEAAWEAVRDRLFRAAFVKKV